ncbi:MAG: exodeoxyribonuclease VII small subunit [Pelagibacterales bacterium]|nr:exodeoxyribonuclease VII small subunit [Pelagibacterales bacterium]
MSDKKNNNEEYENLTFEESLRALEEIVDELDSGSIDLDKAVEAYEKGTQLKLHCENKLKEAKLRIEKIEISKDDEFIKTEINNE